MEDENPQSFKSGFLLSVLISLKLNLAVLVFYLFLKNWRSFAGMIAGFLALHLTLIPGFGDATNIELYKSWLHLLLTQSANQYATFEVQGIMRICYHIFNESLAHTAWAGFLVLSVLFGIYLDHVYFKKIKLPQEKRRVYNGCYWLGIVFFFSPLAWWYQILYLYPVAFLLLKSSLPKKWQALVWLCLACFAFVSFNTIGREGINTFKFYMGYFICAMTLFAIYLAIVVRQKKAPSVEEASVLAEAV